MKEAWEPYFRNRTVRPPTGFVIPYSRAPCMTDRQGWMGNHVSTHQFGLKKIQAQSGLAAATPLSSAAPWRWR